MNHDGAGSLPDIDAIGEQAAGVYEELESERLGQRTSLAFCNGRQRLSSVLDITDRSVESEPDLPGGFEHIETLGVDAGHLRRSAPAILPQRIAMVIVHVLNDSRFLRRGKWIFRHEFAGFYPADPSKSTDESNPYELKPENREGMRLVILTCGWKVSEVSLASVGSIITDRPDIGHAGDAAPCLHVI